MSEITGNITKRPTITANIKLNPIYPELEDLKITPSNKEQVFKSTKDGYNVVTALAVEIKSHYLENTNLILVLNDDSKLSIDISKYINEISNKEIQAINNATVLIENGELIINYDDQILKLDFSLENENLIVDDNVDSADFNINEKMELEAIY